MNAKWDDKVEVFEKLGYHATYELVDTKEYYIPHTRKRGYLVAFKKEPAIEGAKPMSEKALDKWKNMVEQLKRPAAAILDAFMFDNLDPRVLKGRARLSAADEADNSVTKWEKCQTRHQFARASEELGEKHPFTGADSGNTTVPPFAWNEWTNSQVSPGK